MTGFLYLFLEDLSCLLKDELVSMVRVLKTYAEFVNFYKFDEKLGFSC